MIRRYPDKGKITIKTKSSEDRGVINYTDTDIEINGRYEPSSQKTSMDYSAKFYCQKLIIAQYSLDGAQFHFNGKQFRIVQLHNYQTHCEIWLE